MKWLHKCGLWVRKKKKKPTRQTVHDGLTKPRVNFMAIKPKRYVWQKQQHR